MNSWTIRLTWPANPIAPASDVSTLEAVLLPGGSIILGRHQDADVRLVDGFASPMHAMIEIFEGPGCPARVGIRDLDSGNGTYANGHRVTTTEIREGDRLTIGGTVIKVEKCQRTAAQKTAPPPALLAVNAVEGNVRRAAGDLVEAALALSPKACSQAIMRALGELCPGAALEVSKSIAELERRFPPKDTGAAPTAQPKGPPPAPLTPAEREAQIPERVILAARRDAVLCATLVQWVQTGRVPVSRPKGWETLLGGATLPADLLGALAWALEEMAKSKAQVFASWQRDRETNGLPRRG